MRDWHAAAAEVADRGRRALFYLGVDLVRPGRRYRCPRDLRPEIAETINAVKPYTMTSPERVNALCEAVEYLVRNSISGPIVECGVWRGGSMMAAALTLQRLGDEQRDLYLFDTFAGMTAPTDKDRDASGVAAATHLARRPGGRVMAEAPLEDVERNVGSLGYEPARLRFVRGPVEETIPGQAPSKIALLRLDTDWYESTKHELAHLFPRIVPGGVLILDDYGHWQGARRAVDEYLAANDVRILLHRVDETGRVAVVG